MGCSAIREILKVVSRPGMVSLAGGIPAPESFPLDLIPLLTDGVLTKYGASALQYDPTEGFEPLRNTLSDYLSTKGVTVGPEGILVTSGSQSALDLLGMVLLSKGDRVAVEAPTYLGALQALRPYQPEFVTLETDDEGIIPEALEMVLQRGSVKLVYLVPTFQNPTGRTISLKRRIAVARIVRKYGVLLAEDDPYSDLRYSGTPLPTIRSFAPDQTIYIGTLSKVFAPGLRIGFCVAPERIRHWMVVAKQGVDLHTSTFNQALAAEYISGGHMAEHIPDIIRLYRPRRDAMLAVMARDMPRQFSWSRPEGGMFVWVAGPAGLDMASVYHDAVERNVAFVPGTHFYPYPGVGSETMRLNFTKSDSEKLSHAVGTLADVLNRALTSSNGVRWGAGPAEQRLMASAES
jgi:2-aminoadipate transaminase